MLNKFLYLFFVLFVLGCSYEGQKIQNYLDDPRSLIKDPHFMGYRENRDKLESRYLRKDLTYAEYLEQKEALDQEYAREVQERTAIVESQSR